MKNYPSVGSLFLRLSLAAVMAWFGASQVTNPAQWVNLIPTWAVGISPFSRAVMIYLNGSFEIVASLLLALGVYSRYVALLLAVHLLVIAESFGASPTGVRDFGLSFALIAVFIIGQDEYCLDKKETEVIVK
ncbi:MAG: DoxX family membrane protein [Candidatus Magasanikbacteria bacterium]|nr:DoxX family membrane protein [Candidatus Magasanikbacteria bacterium]